MKRKESRRPQRKDHTRPKPPRPIADKKSPDPSNKQADSYFFGRSSYDIPSSPGVALGENARMLAGGLIALLISTQVGSLSAQDVGAQWQEVGKLVSSNLEFCGLVAMLIGGIAVVSETGAVALTRMLPKAQVLLKKHFPEASLHFEDELELHENPKDRASRMARWDKWANVFRGLIGSWAFIHYIRALSGPANDVMFSVSSDSFEEFSIILTLIAITSETIFRFPHVRAALEGRDTSAK